MTGNRKASVLNRLREAAGRLRRSPPLRPLEPLWRRLQPLWDAVLARLTRASGIEVTINGDRLRLTYAYGARYARSGWEPRVHEAFTTTIEEGMTVADVGAHVGFFTLASALRVGPSGHVVAFEPAPRTAEILRSHVALNGLEDRIDVVEALVGAEKGTATLFVSGDTMSASILRKALEELSPQRFEEPIEGVVVPAWTLDGYCAAHGLSLDRVKIDAEGSELLVLQGATEILSSPAEILCEVHPDHLRILGTSEDDLALFVRAYGREPVAIDEPNELGIYHVLLQSV